MNRYEKGILGRELYEILNIFKFMKINLFKNVSIIFLFFYIDKLQIALERMWWQVMHGISRCCNGCQIMKNIKNGEKWHVQLWHLAPAANTSDTCTLVGHWGLFFPFTCLIHVPQRFALSCVWAVYGAICGWALLLG